MMMMVVVRESLKKVGSHEKGGLCMVFLATLIAVLVLLTVCNSVEAEDVKEDVGGIKRIVFSKGNCTRKLLQSDDGSVGGGGDVNRIGTECSKNDITILQKSINPLPNGIPAFEVQILNVCASGCSMCNIHVSCGSFSSVRLVNPNVFKRVNNDDCLVNNGDSLASGQILSFQYANSFSYPLSVTSVVCC